MLPLLLSLLAVPWTADPDRQGHALVLGAQVSTACGDPYGLAEVGFTAVTEHAGVETERAAYLWSPRAGTLRVRWDHIEVTFDQLHPYLHSAAPQELAVQAYVRWLRDSYWLLAPCKVTDDGVTAAAEGSSALTLTFQGVGLTPGDTYRMEVDPSGQVTGWSFTLQSGRAGSFEWTDHARHGPLSLSTTRIARDGDTMIRFEDVSAE